MASKQRGITLMSFVLVLIVIVLFAVVEVMIFMDFVNRRITVDFGIRVVVGRQFVCSITLLRL